MRERVEGERDSPDSVRVCVWFSVSAARVLHEYGAIEHMVEGAVENFRGRAREALEKAVADDSGSNPG